MASVILKSFKVVLAGITAIADLILYCAGE